MPILIPLLCESNKCQCFNEDGGPDFCPPSLDPCIRIKPQCSKGDEHGYLILIIAICIIV